MLYSSENLDLYPETTPGVNDKNAYEISFTQYGYNAQSGSSSDTFPVLFPTALENFNSIKAGQTMKLMIGSYDSATYRMKVRALASQVPG